MIPNFERDLIDCQPIKEKVRNDNGYAKRLYDALCNTRWYHDSHIHGIGNEDDGWSCSWRYAGGLVATLRACGEDYSDYYCSGNEGCIADDIYNDLIKIGWDGGLK